MSIQAPKFTWGHININVSNLEQCILFEAQMGEFRVYVEGAAQMRQDLVDHAQLTFLPDARFLVAQYRDAGLVALGIDKLRATDVIDAVRLHPVHV